MTVPDSARALINSNALAHMVTLNEDGSPQVTLVWVGLDGDDVVVAHLRESQKVHNIRNDGRVAINIQSPTRSEMGLTEYLTIYGQATIEEGGAPELLQELAYTYLGPDIKFPPMPDPPPGFITRVNVERISGVGPWTGRAA